MAHGSRGQEPRTVQQLVRELEWRCRGGAGQLAGAADQVPGFFGRMFLVARFSHARVRLGAVSP